MTARNKVLMIATGGVAALAAAVLALAVSAPALAQTPVPTQPAKPSRGEFKGNWTITQTLITEVITGSPAATAGLKAGDIVVTIDGKAIAAKDDLTKAVAAKKPGDALSLELQAGDGSKRIVSVTLGDNPQKAGTAFLGVRYGVGFPHGAKGDKRGGQGGFGGRPDGRGMRGFGLAGPITVAEVQANSPAATAGVLKGDVIAQVNGAAASDLRALRQTLASAKVGDKLTLTVTRGGEAKTLDVTLGENPSQKGVPYLGISIAPPVRNIPLDPNKVPATPGVSS